MNAPAPVTTRTTPYYTQQEASELCDVSIDTIRRRRRDGRFPNAVQREATADPQRPWIIPLDDLIEAGLYELAAGGVPAPDVFARQRTEDRESIKLRIELAEKTVRCEALEELLEEQRKLQRTLHKTIETLASVRQVA